MQRAANLTQFTESVPVPVVTADKTTTFTRTRRFIVEWDNSRIPPRNRIRNHSYDYDQKQRADGVHFGNGLVALDNGSGFETLSELEILLALNGKYAITWLDK